jgi:hypothetical protein
MGDYFANLGSTQLATVIICPSHTRRRMISLQPDSVRAGASPWPIVPVAKSKPPGRSVVGSTDVIAEHNQLQAQLRIPGCRAD